MLPLGLPARPPTFHLVSKSSTGDLLHTPPHCQLTAAASPRPPDRRHGDAADSDDTAADAERS